MYKIEYSPFEPILQQSPPHFDEEDLDILVEKEEMKNRVLNAEVAKFREGGEDDKISSDCG